MKIRKVFRKEENFEKYNIKILDYDRTSNSRPAWIKFKNVPDEISFISIHLGKKGKGGYRIQIYKRYLGPGLNIFIPVDFNSEEMRKYYNIWAKTYDSYIKNKTDNVLAGKFIVDKIKKYLPRGDVLDLGAGTGIITELFAKEGFNVTLVDYSKEMLAKARRKRYLKNSNFVCGDIRKLNINKKFDLIISFFSFANSSYFKENELDNLFKIVKKHLKSKGIIAVLGHTNKEKFRKDFKIIEEGVYELSKKDKFYTDYFIGRKR